MEYHQMAENDFERALFKSFWRRALSRVTGGPKNLLPFEAVREKVSIRGQHYLGLRQVPLEQIVGSEGRFLDFDRAFLPTQTRTRDRWVSIDRAHYELIDLPPVELYKLGEVYFVKDGNHRVSVARERGQLFIDAYVIEVDIPVPFTTETRVDDLVLYSERHEFLAQTRLDTLRPGAAVRSEMPGQYPRLLEHIQVHRWYLGEQRKAEVPLSEAAVSWYDHVYLPLVEAIRAQGILDNLPGWTEADLYLWIMEYKGLLRQAAEGLAWNRTGPAERISREIKVAAARKLANDFPAPRVDKLVQMLKRTQWIEALILNEERAAFLETTQLHRSRPQMRLETSVPGQYEKLKEHINVHRWYLGEERRGEVSVPEAAASWYDQVYWPLVAPLEEQGLLDRFPGRTETDLYLWVISRQWILQEKFGELGESR